jgi:hypothetical protein
MNEPLELGQFLADLSRYQPPALLFRKNRLALDFTPTGAGLPRVRLRLLGLAAFEAGGPAAVVRLESGSVGPAGTFATDVAHSENWPEAQSFSELEIRGRSERDQPLVVFKAVARSITLVTRWDPNLP